MSSIFTSQGGAHNRMVVGKRKFTIAPPPPAPVLPAIPAAGREVFVASIAELVTAVNSAQKNDHIILLDGVYNNSAVQDLEPAVSPVVVKAEHIVGVTLTGSHLNLMAPGIVFHGFNLKFTEPLTASAILIEGAGCRFMRNKIELIAQVDSLPNWVVVRADDVLVDHNEFVNKTTERNMLTIINARDGSTPQNVRVIKNYFHDFSGASEAVRTLDSATADREMNAEIAYNRFEQINGETETNTMKGTKVNVHHNTFIDNNSSHTLRHGSSHKFENNICIRCGLRFYGKNNTIKNNLFVDNPNNQLRQSMMIGNGTGVEELLDGLYAQVRDNIIENNIIVNINSNVSHVLMQLGFGTVGGNFPPVSNKIRNNILMSKFGTLTGVNNAAKWSENDVSGNILWVVSGGNAAYGDMPTSGHTREDPLLVSDRYGVYRFTRDSPLKFMQDLVFLDVTDVGVNAD